MNTRYRWVGVVWGVAVGMSNAQAASTETLSVSLSTPSTVSVSTPPVSVDPLPGVPLGPITLEMLPLTAQEAAPTCKIIEQKRPARSEAQVFYEHGIYSTLLPLVFKKTDQAFQCGRDKGMVYYFEYNEIAGREKAELGTRAALWEGDTQATAKRPEHIFGWDRFMIVMSFKTLQKEVMGALVKKLKRFQAAAPTTPPRTR